MNIIAKVKESITEELKDFEWADLGDIDTIGSWPGIVKTTLGIVIFCACVGSGYWFHIKNLQESLAGVVAQEADLRDNFESKAALAANLDIYRQQMLDMEESFGFLLNRLPAATEVPGLLDDITFTGLGSGLDFSLFQPQNEITQEFYIELPINIHVSGGYHDFGTFVSGVASLPRIVTLHDFAIKGSEGNDELSMTILAKTYRYNAGDE